MELKEPSAKYLARAGYQQSEVGLIPLGWSVRSIKELAPLQRGFDLPNSKRLEGPFPVVYSNGAIASHVEAAVRGPGVVTGRSGTIGRVHFVAEDYWPHNTSLWVTRFNDNDPRFIYHLYSHVRFERFSSGSGVPTLNRNDLHSHRLAAPSSRTEQSAISEALTNADDLIESLEQLLAKKRQIKQGAMQELLTGQRRLPGFAGEWTLKTLSQLASIQRGASPRPIDNPIWFDEDSSVGWVRISDVTQAGIYLKSTTQRLSALGVQHSRPVPKGSLIMSICATVGRPVITTIDTCIHDGFVVFDRLQADQAFVYYVLRSIEDNWSRQGQTGSQMNLNTGLINSTVVAMPPTTEEQTAIVTILSDMDTEITALETRLTKARHLKQGMAQALLTGRIRLESPP